MMHELTVYLVVEDGGRSGEAGAEYAVAREERPEVRWQSVDKVMSRDSNLLDSLIQL
jgi:hypothetical protein